MLIKNILALIGRLAVITIMPDPPWQFLILTFSVAKILQYFYRNIFVVV